jgi:hypothetical protein
MRYAALLLLLVGAIGCGAPDVQPDDKAKAEDAARQKKLKQEMTYEAQTPTRSVTATADENPANNPNCTEVVPEFEHDVVAPVMYTCTDPDPAAKKK